jgi:hypothetical protein
MGCASWMPAGARLRTRGPRFVRRAQRRRGRHHRGADDPHSRSPCTGAPPCPSRVVPSPSPRSPSRCSRARSCPATAQAGPPWISLELPVNPFDTTTRGALAVVHLYHHGDATAWPLEARAVGTVDGQRRTVRLETRPGGSAGRMVIRGHAARAGRLGARGDDAVGSHHTRVGTGRARRSRRRRRRCACRSTRSRTAAGWCRARRGTAELEAMLRLATSRVVWRSPGRTAASSRSRAPGWRC